jgi:chaperonin GroES
MPQPSIFRESAMPKGMMGDMNAMPMDDEVITKIEDLPDGSSVYEIGQGEMEEEKEDEDFKENLAEKMPETALAGISSQILEGIEQDKESRMEWEQAYLKGIKYLGWKLEDFKDVPFMSACRAFDTTLSTAVIAFYARSRPLLFPRTGPVDFKINGEPSDELEDQGRRIAQFMNYYLVDKDKDYYADCDRLLMYIPIVGCIFRKVYIDPITDMPLSRMIDPQDIIINNNCVTILSSDRITHKIALTKQEIRLRQLSGFYRDVELPGITSPLEDDSQTSKAIQKLEGINLDSYEKSSLFDVFESHVNLCMDDFDYFEKESKKVSLPLPYIVSICVTTHKVLSLRRNWKKGDTHFKARDYFVQYNYLPGLGLYGMGLPHIIGSNAVVLTSIERQLLDAGTLKNFPGGLKVKGLRIENNDKPIGPSEFLDVETGGMPIRDAIMTMPYSEPSVVLKELRNELMQQTQVLASTSESQVVENNVNAPATTTLALLEVTDRFQASIFESIHISLQREMQLMYSLFGEVLPDSPYPFKVPGHSVSIMRRDFNDNIRIIPVSDPKHTTSTQRMLRAKSLQEIAMMNPTLYNLREVNKRVLEAMRIENIDELLLPSQDNVMPLDPITENMNAMTGKPIKAAIWQDHQSHIMVHTVEAQNNPALQAHINEHRAYEYLVNMEMAMGVQLPPIEMIQSPDVQNTIALQAAQVAQQQLMAQQQAQQAQMIDPNQVLMADIEQRREASYLKDEETKLKAKTDIHKSQLKFEGEKLKMNTQKEIAREKNHREEKIAHIKLSTKHHQ